MSAGVDSVSAWFGREGGVRVEARALYLQVQLVKVVEEASDRIDQVVKQLDDLGVVLAVQHEPHVRALVDCKSERARGHGW